jgi:transcriptional regulator with XRE-family HTH domain
MNEFQLPEAADVEDGAVDHVYRHVGRQLRTLRIGRGMTQAETAKLIAVSPQQYQKYEEGHSKCSLTNLMILADAHSVPIVDLIPEGSPRSSEINEADLLARLVAAYSRLENPNEKLRLVQLVEAIQEAHSRI